MIHWPKSLIREIAARRCIFFLGAGISASATDMRGKRPKTWSEFLNEACSLVRDEKKHVVIKKLIKENKFLLALQGIREAIDPSDFRRLLDNNFNNHGFQPSTLHKLIHQLDQRIVITTNFDRIYENYCLSSGNNLGAFKVINYYSQDLCDELRSDARLIVKAHGSIDEVRKMIFTRGEYHKARSEYPHFYEVMKALFLTQTVVFFGCGLQDPDVLLLLEDVKIIGDSQRPHYVIVLKDEQSYPVISDWKATFNVAALEYGPNYADLESDIEELVRAVEEERIETGVS